MNWIRHILGCSGCVFIVAAFLGCAAGNPELHTDGAGHHESLRPGFHVVYRPVNPPGMTWNDAANNLEMGHKGAWNLNISPGGILQSTVHRDRLELLCWAGKDDRKEVSTLFFYSLLNADIVVEQTSRGAVYIFIPEVISLYFLELNRAKQVADGLLFMQSEVRRAYASYEHQLALFEPVAARYRSLEIKPPMSEEQRKLIVQANALTERKQYFQAGEKYRRAIELDPVSYPAAYFKLLKQCHC